MVGGKGLRLGLHPASVPTSPGLFPSFIKQEAGSSEQAGNSMAGTQWLAGPLALHSCWVSLRDAMCEVGLCCTKDVSPQESNSEAELLLSRRETLPS